MELARCDFLNMAAARGVFSADYAEARRTFVSAAEGSGLVVDTRDHPKCGPHGEPLACDIVWAGPRAARRVVVLIAGTHGVEGFGGSAVLSDWVLGGGPDRLPDGVAVLMIHAPNPYGFAWLRRVNEDGVDLNRNFVDFEQPLPGDEGYAAVSAMLSGPNGTIDLAALHAYAAEHGYSSLEPIVSLGQYSDPDGLFYGGTHPTWSRRTIESVALDYGLSDRSALCVIDLHSGTGPYGYGELICDHAPGSTGLELARHWFGPTVVEIGEETSAGQKNGLCAHFWQSVIGDNGCTVCLEFGTVPYEETLAALAADQWLHAQGGIDWNAPHARRIKAQVRAAFYPEEADWQEMVLFRGRQVMRRALAGLVAQAHW